MVFVVELGMVGMGQNQIAKGLIPHPIPFPTVMDLIQGVSSLKLDPRAEGHVLILSACHLSTVAKG